jgi:glycosyltransferase involved in cell wall biosynthesis
LIKISIVTINLNNYFGLNKTLKCLENQTYSNFELIIVDSVSHDGSIELIKESSIISYSIIEKDNGIYDAINKGVKAANGEYILILNSGDILYNEFVIEDVSKHITQNERYGIIYGKAVYSYKSRPLNWRWPLSTPTDMWISKYNPHHQASFIRKDIYKKYEYDIRFRIGADIDFWNRIKPHNSFKYIDKDISFFDLGGVSNSLNNFQILIQQICESSIIFYFSKNKNSIKLIVGLIKIATKYCVKFILRHIFGLKKYYSILYRIQKVTKV